MREIHTIGIAGAGAMGRGIAQIAAQAGLAVVMFDVQPAALVAARDNLDSTFQTLVSKGKITREAAQAAMAGITFAEDIKAFADCDLVIEAIVERLDVKQQFFRQLETVVAPDCILVSNTSSLSITSIAAVCERPARVAGYHFFNPVPLMKVVEVVDGLRSDPK